MSVRDEASTDVKEPISVPWPLIWLLAFWVVPLVITHYTTIPHTAVFSFLSGFTTKSGVIDAALIHDLLISLATVSATLWVIVFAVLTLSAGMLSLAGPPVEGISFGAYFSSRSLYWLLANSEMIAVCFQTTMLGSLMLLIPGLPAKAVAYFATILLVISVSLSVYRNWLQPVIASEQQTLNRDLDAAVNQFSAQTADMTKRREIIEAANEVLADYERLSPSKRKRATRATAVAFVEAIAKLDSDESSSESPRRHAKDEIIAKVKAAQERVHSESAEILKSGRHIQTSLESIHREYGRQVEVQKVLTHYSADWHRDLVRLIILILTFRLLSAPSGMLMLILLGTCLVMGIIMSLRTGFGIVSASARTR
ncbi:MAG TPA: hypothetical protein VJP85_05540 [Candidatus Baltobacteraceae bacterium]|nr:hypothetical protein [Candidatus Baltobacteraceae bacterium]